MLGRSGGLRRPRIQDQQLVQLRPAERRQVPQTSNPFECDNPMDMQFDEDGHFYLLTYGDGFFNINNDAGMYRWDYVKGQRAPIAVLSATPTNGRPVDRRVLQRGIEGSRPGRLDPVRWDFDGTARSTPSTRNRVHHTTPGQYTARLTVFDSTGKSAGANTTITVGNTAPTVTIEHTGRGRTVRLR